MTCALLALPLILELARMEISCRFVYLFVVLPILSGDCATTPLVHSPNANNMRTGKADPDGNAKELGLVTGTDGSGCGLYGIVAPMNVPTFGSRTMPHRLRRTIYRSTPITSQILGISSELSAKLSTMSHPD